MQYSPYEGNKSEYLYNNISNDLSNDLSKQYNVDENYYVELAMKQWKMKPTEVAKEYFSVSNIKRLQKGIKREIYNRSYGKYKLKEDQDVLDLIVAMIHIYDRHSKNLPNKIIKQVKLLNEHTIQCVAPDMMTVIKQYYGYLKDINNPINPIELPINVNNAGRQFLPGAAHVYDI
jgi:hypothetical protein